MSQNKLIAVAPGSWGGTGVRMNVTKADVQIEFDCAQAEIRVPLKKDKKGNFKVDGFYKRETFGPIRLDNQPKFVPAHFEGNINGGTLTFKLSLTDTQEDVGSYTLELGKEGRVRKCR